MVTFGFLCSGARLVTLAGDFNAWNVSAHPMIHDAHQDVWTIALRLESARHEYKFFVDGRDWWNDPNSPTVPNVWGSENSYVDVD